MVQELQLRVKYIADRGNHINLHCGVVDDPEDWSHLIRGAIGSLRQKVSGDTPAGIPAKIKIKLSKNEILKLFRPGNRPDLYIKPNGDSNYEKVMPVNAKHDFMERLMLLMESNMSNDDYWVDGLSTDMNVSRSTLFRKLKDLTGQAPQDFMKTVRLRRSRQLLENGRLRVAEVAYEVGFADPNYFSKCFRKFFGNSPSSYIPSLEHFNHPPNRA